ncbi:MAG TPA: sigma 54-interacting transcriptional regulator [Polyangiaceae bacterium]|nr:sigma 54-interacting transcriptional regulator [Polyangiaceae bacterium]
MTTRSTPRVLPSPPPAIGPERVRELRGSASRAAFARRLGVTPHTVYRWELPDEAAEARRPRGEALQKLLALGGEAPEPPSARGAANASHASSPGVVALAERRLSSDVAAVLPSLERSFAADPRRAHDELVQLLVKRQQLSPDALGLARFGVAALELLGRSDPRAALLVIAPALADIDAGRLAPEVAGRVLAAAALVHALPDASLFDLGRVHAYAARADALSTPAASDGPCLSLLAQLCAATVVADRELLDRAYARLEEFPFVNLPPLLDLHLDEFRALRPQLAGKAGGSVKSFDALAERAAELGCHVLEARALGHSALGLLENLGDPRRALDVARRSRQLGRGGRIAPGIHTVFAIRAELEALLRLGRTEEALALLGELDVWTAETGLVPLTAVPFQVRLLFLTGRREPLLQIADKLRRCEVSALRPISLAYAAMAEAAAAIASSEDPLASVAAFEHAESEAGRWPYLLRFVLMHRVIAHLIAGQEGAARLALRRTYRFLDVFPSAWVSAHLRRLEGTLAAAQGDWKAARQLLESAIATFELAHDACDAALCRHLCASFAAEYGDGAREDVEAAQRALDELGIQSPRALAVGIERLRASRRGPSRSMLPREAVRVEDLVVPLRRLSARGVAPALLLRELESIVSGLFPGRRCRLEELDSGGRSHLVWGAPDSAREPAASGRRAAGDASGVVAGGDAAPAADAAAPGVDGGFDWVEFSNGAGRLFRVGVAGELSEPERSSLSVLSMAAALALEAASLRGASDPFEPAASDERPPDIPGFIAGSPEMRRLKSELMRLAGSRATVIISGESGSGKEVVARAIHALSERASESYIPFNCSTVPRDLFEGQLFGYRRGAFTGAAADHAGVIRAADGGTLFLDEIAELPLDVQPKLLRFLENAEVFPLGEHKPVKVDVRVIAATHRDLAELVRLGRFREDLYYRLQVVPIHVPPLRERPGDVPLLARHFARELSAGGEPPVFAPDAIAALLAHSWRGNVRELRNVIERALAFSPRPDLIEARHLRLAPG